FGVHTHLQCRTIEWMFFAEELAKLANLGILDHDGSLLGLRGNHIVNRQARGGGNSNCRWAGILIVADHSLFSRLASWSGGRPHWAAAHLYAVRGVRRVERSSGSATPRVASRGQTPGDMTPGTGLTPGEPRSSHHTDSSTPGRARLQRREARPVIARASVRQRPMMPGPPAMIRRREPAGCPRTASAPRGGRNSGRWA